MTQNDSLQACEKAMNDSFVFATHKPDALFLHKRDLVQNELNYIFNLAKKKRYWDFKKIPFCKLSFTFSKLGQRKVAALPAGKIW